MIKPSPFVASLLPGEAFNPERHIAFGDVFLEKNMSGAKAEGMALSLGAGLPDRGDQGWITLSGDKLPQIMADWFRDRDSGLEPGEGICDVIVEAVCDQPVDLYLDWDNCLYISLPRVLVREAMDRLLPFAQDAALFLADRTGDFGRMAVMGPDSMKLLHALGVEEGELSRRGSHREIQIIMEPVRICRSDFAGKHGYDFIIPMEPFNMILAAICSWGVRLEMNLLPVGWNTIWELIQKN